MPSKTCPACGKQAEGRFCSWCGASLGGVHCSSCGAEGEPGARFCNVCGAPLGAAGEARGSGGGGDALGQGSRLVWAVAGLVMVALILAIALPRVLPDRAGEPVGQAGGAAGQAGTPNIADLTPRQAADQLYDRIMSTAESGDSASAAFFLPMGIQAYDRARPLDADGLFHLSLLQGMAGDAESALATAEEALAAYPGHLLNLAAAGRAAAQAGDTALARSYYETFLDVYDEEMAKGIEEYELHTGMMPELRREARGLAAEGEGGQ